MHTNGTIGALLNATFGNAPELLIASAALRKGYYRVVQLAMLGSMLTNLLFVFGVSCLIGGLRWQVQELRITSGNVSVGMLLLSTAGSLLPATLVLGGQLKHSSSSSSSSATVGDDNLGGGDGVTPTLEELQFCRVNAFVMIIMYGCYLIFQLGTHKEEFDEDDNVVQTADDHQLHLSPHFTSRHGRQQKARRNVFCMWLMRRARCGFLKGNNEQRMAEDVTEGGAGGGDVEMMYRENHRLLGMIPNERDVNNNSSSSDGEDESSTDEECLLPQNKNATNNDGYFDDYTKERPDDNTFLENSSLSEPRLRSRGSGGGNKASLSPNRDRQQMNGNLSKSSINKLKKKKKKNGDRPPGVLLPLGLAEPSEAIQRG